MKTKSMEIKDNDLYMGDFKLETLAKTYKTPLYIYDEIHIREKLDTFKSFFTSALYECETVYASKAFLAPYICDIIKEYNMGIDSVSLGDLYLIQKAKFPMNKIVMHGNNKSIDELTFCVDNNVGLIVVDNYDELMELESVTKKLKKETNILIRVNPGIEAHTHAYIKTSLLSSKFGESIYDLEKIKKIVKGCSNSKFIHLQGFHAHIGSSINNPQSFLGEVEVMVDFIKTIFDKTGFETKILNLGGGFGIKYLDSDVEIDLQTMLTGITNKVDTLLNANNLKIEKLMIEPGRSVVGDAGVTVYYVGGMKETFGGKKYVFVDGGMTDNIRPALYQAKYTVDIINKMKQDKTITYDVVGKCCESGDIVATDIMLPPVHKGDYVIAYSTGAYGYAMASNYNGALKSEVIFVNKDQVNVAIKRETLDDLVKTAIFPSVKMFDCHSDMLYDLYTKKKAGIVGRFKNYHIPQLQHNTLKGALWTMYSPDDFNLIEACKSAIKEIDMTLLPDFQVILGLEGLRNLKTVEDIDVLYKLGFRHAMLTWNEENKYATGAKADPEHGLKPDGIRLLKKMADLDMIIDLAHLNEKSFYEVLDVTQKNIIYSHGNVKALCDHVRNVTDEQMQALKKVNGLLGLTLANNFIASDPQEQTLSRFLDHIDYAVKVMSIDNVCFGFDFMDYLSDFPNSNLPAVNDATKVDAIIEGLRSRGYSDKDINKICWNNFYNRYKDKVVLKG